MKSLGRDESGMEQFIGSDADGNVLLKTTFDNEAVIDHNKRIEGTGMGKDMRLAASIPIGVQYEWIVKHGVQLGRPEDAEKIKKLLNSSDYRYLRINHFIM